MKTVIKHIRIKQKLAIAPVLIILAALALGGLAWRMTAAQDGALDALYHDSFAKKQLGNDLAATLMSVNAGLYRSITWQNAGADDKTVKVSIDATTKLLDSISGRLETIEAKVGTAGTDRAALAELHTAAVAYVAKAREVLDMLDGDPVMAVTMLRQAERLYAKVEQAVAAWSDLQKQANDALFERTQTNSHESLVAFFLIMAAAFGSATIIVLVVGHGISGGIARMTQAMTCLASGDTTVSVPASHNRDEIGDMARAVQVFKDQALENDRLRLAHEGEQQRGQERLKSEMLSLTVQLEGEVDTTVADISSQAERLTEGASRLLETAEELQAMAQAMSAAIEITSGNVQTVAGATEELEASSREISARIQRSSVFSEAARRKVDAASASVGTLTQATARIADVVTLIQAIAGQTRMLSLNATIEAARAGDMGKGFAVVAGEVKGLAGQTEDAIGRVNAQAQDIGRTTQEAVATVEAVAESIRDIDAIAGEVAVAADEQRAATAEIMASAVQAADHTRSVADNAGKVLTGAKLTGDTARQVSELSSMVTRDIAALQRRLNVILRTSYGGNRRAADRIPVALEFRATFGGQSFTGHTGDISDQGALLVLGNVPDLEGTDGTIDFAGIGVIQATAVPGSSLGIQCKFHTLGDTQKKALADAIEQAKARDLPFITIVQQTAAKVAEAFETAVRDNAITVDDLFSTDYTPIPNTDPMQVMAKHTELTDRLLPGIIEAPLSSAPNIALCCATDRNGYIATHNQAYSAPQRPDDPVWNAAHCRNRRIFDDRTGILAARNTQPYLTQTYARDMGGGSFILLKEIDAPILVAGRQWGALRLAIKL